MLKKISCFALMSACALSTQAFDKTQIDLQKDFWGTWTVYNAKTKCTESYQFTQPSKVQYTAKQKKMTGEFAVIRNQDPKILDIFAMNVSKDNKKAGCNGQPTDFTKAQIRLSLKWISAKTAELCTDLEGKQCLGLYFIKQK
ncbi:hypothetical protein [Acinetobacter sp. YH12075]|uniref:hypothetical protein n=1 Tax=Acinetobacter sp. YH12075 TaxID=2601070 RepID=UPI0015D2EA7B|nr:hypothetical protein [Acinetobacter sp. YH12075]